MAVVSSGRNALLFLMLFFCAVLYKQLRTAIQSVMYASLRDDNTYDIAVNKITHEVIGGSRPKEKKDNDGSDTNSRPKKNVPYNKLHQPILFLHFHKAGGTEACHLMFKFQSMVNLTGSDGLKLTTVWPRNCNSERSGPYTDPRPRDPQATMNCREFVNYSTTADGAPRNNFVAIEVPMDGAFGCPHFRNFVLVRNPVSRCLSHMKVRKWDAAKVVPILNATSKPSANPANMGKRAFVLRVYSSMDNMQVRQLVGIKRMVDIDRPVDENDLEQAKRVVDQLDVVVPTEQQLHPTVLQLFQERLPEYHQALHTRYRAVIAQLNGTAPEKRPTSYKPDPQLLRLLQEHNRYDMMLYEYVNQKLGIPLD